MIRLKQKKAADISAEAEEKKVGEASDASGTIFTERKQLEGDRVEGEATSEDNGGLKLLGIGGKSSRQSEGVKKLGKKKTPGEIRIQKDISDLDGGSVAQIDFPNPNDLTNFNVTVVPDTGPWTGASYNFTFAIPALYPHEPPKVKCNTRIYHPNIDLTGAVCLNILKEDWKPVLDINAVIYGLIYLFYEPNPDDPLNREAADLFRTDREQFGRVVRRTLQGHSHSGASFPKLI